MSGLIHSQTYIPPVPWRVDTLIVVPSADYQYQFPERHRLQPQSIEIFKNRNKLEINRDFRIINNQSINFFSLLTAGDSLQIIYRRRPVNFKRSYVLFEKDTLNQPVNEDSTLITDAAVRLKRVKFENPFANIQTTMNTSGSIMRGVEIGTNRDLTLNSGLNLELSGQLTENLEVVAALTDEATPIQPEGNTQTLDEVDKVFVRFKSPYVEGTVGDFNLSYENSEFGRLSRKLQGITLRGNYKQNYLGGTVATTRGFFNRIQFIGQEGNQGPYQLTGKNGESEIIVLAGTERVWINGERMTRGEANDYIIEYGNGQIIFTNNRLITSESRVEIDYEYFPADQKYNRNVYSGIFGTSLSNNKIDFDVQYYREADDPDQAIEQAGLIDEDEKEILKEAGDNPLNAVTSGAFEVEPGKGSYVKIDTLLEGQDFSYYKYVGINQGNYRVSFSYYKNGDYRKDRLGVYRFVGIEQGNYAPVEFIPLPSSHDMVDTRINWRPLKYYHIKAEYALTSLDQNVLSSTNDGDNQGNAISLQTGLSELPLDFDWLNMGELSMNLDGRYIEKTYNSVDRLNRPDYQRYWNVLQEAQSQNEETSLQMNAIYKPIKYLQTNFNTGFLEKNNFDSRRYSGSFRYQQDNIARASGKYEYINSNYTVAQTSNDWWRYSAQVGKDIWKISPEVMYASEKRKNETRLALSGFEYDDIGGKIGLIRIPYLSGSVQYNQRYDRVYDYEKQGKLIPQAETETGSIILDLQNFKETSASLRIIRRNKDYTSKFENIKVDTLRLLYADASVQDTVWQDRTTNLAELNLVHSRWKKAANLTVQYKISTEQTALKEKVYLDVGEGRGNLIYDEDLDEYIPDPNGNYMLFILPSGKLEPITNLETAWRLKFDPAKYWRKNSRGMKNLISKISSESYFRVEEETQESDIRSIYLLNLSKFQKEQTIRGNMTFDQNLYLLRNNRNLTFRYRFRYLKARFNQYLEASENEDRYSLEHGLRTDWRIFNNLKSQSEIRAKSYSKLNNASPIKNRDITGYYYDQRFSYRPISNWEFGLESEYGNEANQSPNYLMDLWYENIKGRINYSIPGKGRASANYTFQVVNVTSNPDNKVVPYEMASGKKEGNSHTWDLRVEYTVAKNVVFTFYYNGRNEANFENVIHTGQAEIRAYF
ncbi:MAG: hypothetical protein P8Y99_06480 [Calditrichaceae bacterium]